MSVHCPECGKMTKVIDSRASEDKTSIRRRRECLNKKCRERFTTHETIIPAGVQLPNRLREQQRAFKLLAMVRKIMDSRNSPFRDDK